ncbi:MAG TPA: phosphoribosylaminoimidazolesuccinocarboxamide synthase, partial [Longimicrobiales bacterium]|nr:phosphoribosylaminoimidazolesuccinocarboxamide synthase [Longimicrobiales bacterium]
DENIPFSGAEAALGEEVAAALRARSLALYGAGRAVAENAGILIADTKFEFGRGAGGEILLIDEVLTPDSSRFWPAESYEAGRGQPSLDKQPVRDWLEARVRAGAWDKRPPAPDLPDEVVEATMTRYRDVFHRLTGFTPEEFPTSDPAAAPPGEGAG